MTSGKEDAAPVVRMNAVLAAGQIKKLIFRTYFMRLLGDNDPFLVSAALSALEQLGDDSLFLGQATLAKEPQLRLGIMLALRRGGGIKSQEKLPEFLNDADPAIRRAAIQWVAEAGLNKYADLLDKAATKPPTSRELFEAWLRAPVERPRVYETTTLVDRALAAGETWSAPIALVPDAVRADSTLVVTIDRSGVGALAPGLRALVEYPYGCLEQTLSRFVPLVAAKDLALV